MQISILKHEQEPKSKPWVWRAIANWRTLEIVAMSTTSYYAKAFALNTLVFILLSMYRSIKCIFYVQMNMNTIV